MKDRWSPNISGQNHSSWLDDGCRSQGEPMFLTQDKVLLKWSGTESVMVTYGGQYERDRIALEESNKNKNLNGFELVRKYARDDHDVARILMESLLKYGNLNFWCFVYDLDKKGIYGKDIAKRYEEYGKNLSKFYKSIWSGAEGVIDDIDNGRSKS